MTIAEKRLVSTVVGKRLDAISGLFWTSHGSGDTRNLVGLLAIRLDLEKVVLAIRCSGDGWTLEISTEQLRAADLGSDGALIVRNLAGHVLVRELIGARVRDAWGISSEEGDLLEGIRLDFERGASLFLLNWGDDLYLSDGPPAGYEQEKLTERRIDLD